MRRRGGNREKLERIIRRLEKESGNTASGSCYRIILTGFCIASADEKVNSSEEVAPCWSEDEAFGTLDNIKLSNAILW